MLAHRVQPVQGGAAAVDHAGPRRDLRLTGLTYLPRQDLANRRITQYNIYASTDGTTFTLVGSGTWAQDATLKTATFTADAAYYIRLEGVQAFNNNVSAAEINILGSLSS